MDRVYRRQRHVYDFTRKYYLFGRDRLIDGLGLAPGAALLEVGCGTARNLIRIARSYPGVRLFGLDASAEMLKSAEAAVRRAGLSDRITLLHGLAGDVVPALFGRSNGFDAVLFSYSLSMIPDWKQALNAASGALAAGGKLHIVDFGDLKGLPSAGEKALRWWLSLFHVAPRGELLAAIEDNVDSVQAVQLLWGRYAFILSGPAFQFA